MLFFKILFLMCFTVHNIEEGLWLPSWSLHAKKFHPVVTNREMHFALLAVTILGYGVTMMSYLFGMKSQIVEGLYLGFVAMMVLNVIFPHIIACIVLRRYAPGTMTGLFMVLPLGVWILYLYVRGQFPLMYLAGGTFVFTAVTLALLNPLFFLGRTLIKE